MQTIRFALMTSAMLTCAFALSAADYTAPAPRIEKKGAEFTATRHVGLPEELAKAKASGIVSGCGESDYTIDVPRAGWYELYVCAPKWPTDLSLDGEFLIHTPFDSGVWPAKELDTYKVMNLYLTQGRHTLTFSRFGWPPLMMSRFYLSPSADITGRVRLQFKKDRLAFRRGEAFPVRLTAGKAEQPETLTFTITDVVTGKAVESFQKQVPAGIGVWEKALTISTEREGVFDLTIKDAQGRAVDRTVQYLVVDTKTRAPAPATLEKELVQTIDCATQKPDYEYGQTRVISASFGAYRESGDKGVNQYQDNADSFAYKLHLPSIQEFYLAEVDYPDDDLRTFAIYLLDPLGWDYVLAPGVASGGPYPLSNTMQTRQCFFVPRDLDPRIIFTTWQSGRRAAASRIRIYLVGPHLPILQNGNTAREFGLVTEEALKILSFFGAMPTGNNWLAIYQAAERKAEWSRYIGATHWVQSIAQYQNVLWPSKALRIGGIPGEEVVEQTLKEPFQEDLIRLMLLVCEKEGLGFVGEVPLPVPRLLQQELDRRFGGDGDLAKDGPQKPWLIVSKKGKTPDINSPFSAGYYNPLYPAVQDFIASVFQELADRYKDSPAFKGVAIRLLGWCFSSWQTFPSIGWGYGDYEVGLFQKETGIKVPVAADDPERFGKRYDWLMANAYQPWVEWRCRKIHAYYCRLAGVLTKARPDLKLYVEAFGTTYSCEDTGVGPMPMATIGARDEKGWLALIKESGIDPELYRRDLGIVISGDKIYPPAHGVNAPNADYRAAAEHDFALATEPVEAVRKEVDGATISSGFLSQMSWESEVLAKKYGVEKYGRSGKFGTSCAIAQAGRNFLELYASLMAEGNTTCMYDFTRESLMDQGDLRREFLAEYRSLPAIGMTRVPGANDPVAVWQGKKGGKNYFYMVNQADYPVRATVRFAGKAALSRLATKAEVPLEKDGTLAVSLEAYQLIGYVNAKRGTIATVAATAPAAVEQELRAQLAVAQQLVNGEGVGDSSAVAAFSPVDLKRAQAKLAEAQKAFQEGRYVAVKRALAHHFLAKIYEAMGTRPPNLWFRKIPPAPEKSLAPKALLEKIDPSERSQARVAAGNEIAPSLTGETALVWKGVPLDLTVDCPLPSRYRLRYGCIAGQSYARPAFSIDGQAIPGGKGPASQTIVADEASLFTPVLTKGAHRLTARVAPGQEGGLLFLHMEPVYRDLVMKEWAVIGPFPGVTYWNTESALKALNTVLPPEERRQFAETYAGDEGKTIRWQQPAGDEDYVDLNRITGAYSSRIGYAVTYVESPDECPAELKFGVDYFSRIWLNGAKVFEVVAGHCVPVKGEFTIPITLKKGRNELVVKVLAGSAGNGFWMSISDPGNLEIIAPLKAKS